MDICRSCAIDRKRERVLLHGAENNSLDIIRTYVLQGLFQLLSDSWVSSRLANSYPEQAKSQSNCMQEDSTQLLHLPDVFYCLNTSSVGTSLEI